MSQENVALLHQAIDAFNRRDLDAFLVLCDPDVEFISYLARVEGVSRIAATTVSRTGGRASSPSTQTSQQRSSRYETLAIVRLPGRVYTAVASRATRR